MKGAFFTNPSPTPELCEQLSSELNVKPEQVTRWFSNERSRKRKKEEQRLAELEEDQDVMKMTEFGSKSRKRKKSQSSSLTEPGPSLLPLQELTAEHLTHVEQSTDFHKH